MSKQPTTHRGAGQIDGGFDAGFRAASPAYGIS